MKSESVLEGMEQQSGVWWTEIWDRVIMWRGRWSIWAGYMKKIQWRKHVAPFRSLHFLC